MRQGMQSLAQAGKAVRPRVVQAFHKPGLRFPAKAPLLLSQSPFIINTPLQPTFEWVEKGDIQEFTGLLDRVWEGKQFDLHLLDFNDQNADGTFSTDGDQLIANGYTIEFLEALEAQPKVFGPIAALPEGGYKLKIKIKSVDVLFAIKDADSTSGYKEQVYVSVAVQPRLWKWTGASKDGKDMTGTCGFVLDLVSIQTFDV
jgi:hypothetical protein